MLICISRIINWEQWDSYHLICFRLLIPQMKRFCLTCWRFPPFSENKKRVWTMQCILVYSQLCSTSLSTRVNLYSLFTIQTEFFFNFYLINAVISIVFVVHPITKDITPDNSYKHVFGISTQILYLTKLCSSPRFLVLINNYFVIPCDLF